MDASVYVYRHFDTEGRLLYVGMANHPKRRLVSHGSAKTAWHNLIARSTYERFPNRIAAASAEITAIQTERPLWNVTHNPAMPTRPLHPVRIPKSSTQPITIFIPAEPCFARAGWLISIRTGGPAEHREMKVPNSSRGSWFCYNAVVSWMEWYGHRFRDEYIECSDRPIRLHWVDALNWINADWRYELLHRPAVGLAHDVLPLQP